MTDISDLVKRLDDKCMRLIRMVTAEVGISTEDPRIAEFADDRGDDTDTINLCIDAGVLSQVGNADEGENFSLVGGWWPYSLPSRWRDFVIDSIQAARALEAMKAEVSRLAQVDKDTLDRARNADRRVAEERGRCAQLALQFASDVPTFGAIPADPVLAAIGAAREIASAILSRTSSQPAAIENVAEYLRTLSKEEQDAFQKALRRSAKVIAKGVSQPAVDVLTAPATGRSPISQDGSIEAAPLSEGDV